MRLEHFGRKPISRVLSVSQLHEPERKPEGLWISVAGEYDWPSWCQAEGFGLDRLTVRHDVSLCAEANVLIIPSVQAIDSFHAEFSVNPIGYRRGELIEWARMARRFDGIIIAPYRWERRLDTGVSSWYYGWDCASGCIWNADAIDSITPVREAISA